MLDKIPGTALPADADSLQNPFLKLEALLTSTGGLTLSQVCTSCGLESSTIQNWVKRGLVANPQNKRYSEVQIMRIILINMMRGAMCLDSIGELMSYVNGSVEDRSDDIIPDRALFCLLCRIIALSEREKTTQKADIQRIIDQELESFEEPFPHSKEKLKKALLIMTLAFISVVIREQALCEYEVIKSYS